MPLPLPRLGGLRPPTPLAGAAPPAPPGTDARASPDGAWTPSLASGGCIPAPSRCTGHSAALSARGDHVVDGTDSYVATDRLSYASNGQVVGTKDPNGNETTIGTITQAGTTAQLQRTYMGARHTATGTATATRAEGTGAWAAWVQSVDFASVTWLPRRHHVTRSVLDLEDQVLEVWDARELAQATWKFTYDYAGRRLKTEHTTGTGSRWALADAAGNPIWSRDARGIEVDRTFDALNRPVDEKTDDGSTVKLRRAWSYVDYDDQDPDHDDYQDKNLYGQVEEARDADGVRFFEYDHRGLPVKASHRFWDHAWQSGTDAMWANGGSWDPEVPSTDRASVASWLTLSGLTDTTTVEITTTYDSAGRPTQVDYPESMSLRSTYDEAGHLATLELRRTSAAGFKDVLTDLTYNARGQVTGWVHGNGVETTREYDEDLERLLRIFTKLPGTPDVHFQDLAYDYDPAGNPVKLTDDVDSGGFAHNQVIPNTREYHYDPRYRLVRAKGKKHTSVTAKSTNPLITTPDINDYEPYDYRYVYDEVGNFYKNHEYSRGQLHYKDDLPDLFNGDGREAIDGERDAGNYTYDENGNTTHTPRQQEMAYTHDNQARWVDMGGGTEVQYLRHADQRVVRFSRASSQHSLGIYLGPWEYHDKDGVYTKAVLHAEAHGRHAQAEVVLTGTDSDSLIIWYVHSDHLGSGHVITKADGSLLTQEEYFPYGRASDRRDVRNRYRYIGVERDERTGLCMTGPRTYDPLIGRFLQRDPVLSHKGTYTYSSQQPTSIRDVSGYKDNADAGNEQLPQTSVAIDQTKAAPLMGLEAATKGLAQLSEAAGVSLSFDAPSIVVHPVDENRNGFLDAALEINFGLGKASFAKLTEDDPKRAADAVRIVRYVDAFTDPETGTVHLPGTTTRAGYLEHVPHEVVHSLAHEGWIVFSASLITPVTSERGGTGGRGVLDTLNEGAAEYLSSRITVSPPAATTRFPPTYQAQTDVIEAILASPEVEPADLFRAYFQGQVSDAFRAATIKALVAAPALPQHERP